MIRNPNIRKDNLSNRLYDKYLPHMDHLPDEKQRYWLYYRLWPNLAFDIYPEQMDFMQFIRHLRGHFTVDTERLGAH